jgi:hypothetical protein
MYPHINTPAGHERSNALIKGDGALSLAPATAITLRKERLMMRRTANLGIRRRLLVTGAALVTIGGVITMAAPVTANAAPLSCVFTSGTAGTEYRSQPIDGTIFTKQSDSCKDFNVGSVGTTGYYTGWLFHSATDRWAACSAGAVLITKGGPYHVLCSGVLAGTPMIATSSGHYSLTAEY